MKVKSVGVLTSGGDAPGMNAALRSVVRCGIYNDLKMFGIMRGYQGLIRGDICELNLRSVSDTLQRGGTKLHTARCPEFMLPEGRATAAENLRNRGIDALVVIGGDGTFRGAEELSMLGIKTIGIPATIDNDLAYTDYTVGFDTACNTALEAMNKLRDTVVSHDRVNIVEVMGRHCGDLALYAGLGGGAEIVLLPEVGYDPDKICQALKENIQRGKLSAIIVIAEGAGKAADLAAELKCRTELTVRSTVLGHIQRGGNPSMQDRLLATRFGAEAIKLLLEGKSARVVGIRKNEMINENISVALKMKKTISEELLKIAEIVSR